MFVAGLISDALPPGNYYCECIRTQRKKSVLSNFARDNATTDEKNHQTVRKMRPFYCIIVRAKSAISPVNRFYIRLCIVIYLMLH